MNEQALCGRDASASVSRFDADQGCTNHVRSYLAGTVQEDTKKDVYYCAPVNNLFKVSPVPATIDTAPNNTNTIETAL